MSFETYQKAQTVADKYSERNVHADFLGFINNKEVFSESFFNLKFHVVWGNFGRQSYGPGDFIMFRFTPNGLQCVAMSKPITNFAVGELQKNQDINFTEKDGITWTFSQPVGKHKGENVYYITGTQNGRIAYNYSVVAIKF